jgi:hypothetical protein
MLIKHRLSHLTQGPVFLSTTPFWGSVYGLENWCSRPKSWEKVSKRESSQNEFRAIVTADCSYGISVPLVSQPQDKISNKTKRLPLNLKKEHPHIPRVIVHHNKDIPLPTRRSHTSWANKVHMEQLAWTLIHHISERCLRRSYHLRMPTRRTNQLFLKPQPWQSLDQIEFTQARQKVKVQLTQLPMPLPQLTRRTSQETTLNTRRLRKISSKHLTLENDHTDRVPSRIQNPRTTRPKQLLKTLIQ